MLGKIPTRRGPDAGTFAFVRAVRRWRWWDWVGFNVGLVVAVAVSYLHFSSPPPAISVESYDRITLGMTWREVHDIVRAMPGGYGLYWGPGVELSAGAGPVVRQDRWGSGYGLLMVGYDANGRVCSKTLFHSRWSEAPHPEDWPWWRRQLARTVPDKEPRVIFSPF